MSALILLNLLDLGYTCKSDKSFQSTESPSPKKESDTTKGMARRLRYEFDSSLRMKNLKKPRTNKEIGT